MWDGRMLANPEKKMEAKATVACIQPKKNGKALAAGLVQTHLKQEDETMTQNHTKGRRPCKLDRHQQ
jgi:hypothetical protein